MLKRSLFVLLLCCASTLSGCVGLHHILPPAPTKSPSPTSSPSGSPTPSPSPNVPGGGFAGSMNVAYVGFLDGVMVLPLTGSSYAFAGQPVAPPPTGGRVIDQFALSLDGTKIYDIASAMGPVVYAYAMSSAGETTLGSQQVTTLAQFGDTHIVPLSDGTVAVITSSNSSSQFLSTYSAGMTAQTQSPTAMSSYYFFPVAGGSSDFYALDENTAFLVRFTPPFSNVTPSAVASVSTDGQMAFENGKLYSATYDGASDTSTVYAFDPTTLTSSAIFSAPHAIKVMSGSAKGLGLMQIYNGTVAFAAYMFGSSGPTQWSPPIANLSSSNVGGAALSRDGTKIVVDANVNNAGQVFVIAVGTGTATPVTMPGNSVLPQGTYVLGAPLAF